MISDSDLVLYACISKGDTILAEFNQGGPDLETLASQCVANAPPHHTLFSHTVDKKTYMFLMHGDFVHFAVFKQDLGKPDGLRFLNRVKGAFEGISARKSISGSDNLPSHCFQAEFSPIFGELLSPPALDRSNSQQEQLAMEAGGTASGKNMVWLPLLRKPCNMLKKKKKRAAAAVDEDGNSRDRVVDVSGGGGAQEVEVQKNGGYGREGWREEARERWMEHVWRVLVLDLIVCCVLFGIWVGVCRGFECISD